MGVTFRQSVQIKTCLRLKQSAAKPVGGVAVDPGCAPRNGRSRPRFLFCWNGRHMHRLGFCPLSWTARRFLQRARVLESGLEQLALVFGQSAPAHHHEVSSNFAGMRLASDFGSNT
jgi:hypothetical protein